METEEELAQDALVLNDLIVDGLDHNGQHGWVLEAEVLELYFSLGCVSEVTNNTVSNCRTNRLRLTEGEQSLVMVDTFTWVGGLLYHGWGDGARRLGL